jgi:hypothetical protein
MRLPSPCCVFVAIAAGCGVADFDITQPVPEQMVQGSALPGPLASLFPIPVSLDLQSAIMKQTTSPVGTIELDSLSLTITKTDEPAGDSDDWSFLAQCDVYVESTGSGSTLPRVLIASATSPGAVQTVNFDVVAGVDLKPYVDEGGQVDSDGSGTAPPDDVSYDGSGVFTVHPL